MLFASLWRKLTSRKNQHKTAPKPRRLAGRWKQRAMPRLEWLEDRTVPATITVTGSGNTTAVDGFVTLREAILSTNAPTNADINADVTANRIGAYGVGAVADTIVFNITPLLLTDIDVGAGAGPLPTINEALVIDGTTQTGYSFGVPAITIDGGFIFVGNGLTFATAIAGANLTVFGIEIQNMANDGLRATGVGSQNINLQDVICHDNFGNGLTMLNVGVVNFTTPASGFVSVLSQFNFGAGMVVLGATGLNVNDARFLENVTGGLRVSDIAGNVNLTRVQASFNDTNDDSLGIGFEATDGVDADAFAITGNLTVSGGAYLGDTVLAPQVRGIFVQSLSGIATFQDAAGPFSSILVDGNELEGVVIVDGGTSAVFTNGTYTNNGQFGIPLLGSGIQIASFSGPGTVTFTNVTASVNAGHGLDVDSSTTLNVTGGTYNQNGLNGLDIDAATTSTYTNVQARLNDLDGLNVNASTTVNVTGGDYDDNLEDGFTFNLIAGDITLLNTHANDSGFDGLEADLITGTTRITTSTFNDNGSEGIDIEDAGAVICVGVVTMHNDPGILLDTVAAFTDTDGNYSENDEHGIQIIDISGNVTLTRTRANDNDFDSDGDGDGVNATDTNSDADTFAIGGNLIVNGGQFRETSFGPDQQFGIFADGLGGDATFQNSGAQQVLVDDNDEDGVHILGGVNATFTNGSYINHDGISVADGDGIHLENFTGTLTFTNVQAGNAANFNAGDGIDIDGSPSNLGDVIMTNVTSRFNGGDGLEIDDVNSVSINGANYSDNDGDGIDIDGVGTNVTISNLTVNNSGDDGLHVGDVLGSVTVTSVTANDNDGEGIETHDTGAVFTINVTALRNDPGILVASAASYTDTNGNFSNNDFHGIHLQDIAGLVSLTGTTANDNDFDLDGFGAGVFAEDTGADVDAISIGGLTVSGGFFRDTTGVVNVTTRQRTGIHVDDELGGDAVFQNNGGQAVTVTGNELDGVFIEDANGFNVSITNGTYSNNGIAGFEIQDAGDVTVNGAIFSNNIADVGLLIEGVTISAGDVSLTNVTANTNGLSGARIIGGALSFSDTNGTYQLNNRHGIFVDDISGDVTLTGTTAQNNDRDNDDDGDGFRAIDTGVDADTVAIGGNFTVSGGLYQRTGVATNHQEFGISVRRVGGFGGVAGDVTISGATVTGNEETGAIIDGDATADGIVDVSTSTFSNNGVEVGGPTSDGDGIRMSLFDDVTFDTVTASNNFGDGIDLFTVGDVVFSSVTAGGNDPGALIDTAASFSDTNGVYVANDTHGIQLIDIAGDVTLDTTTLQDNDANNAGGGDGLNATASANPFAIGGNLSISNSIVQDTDGFAGAIFHQVVGIRVASLAGSADLTNNTVTGNQSAGVFITDGGTTLTVTGGTYSNNGSSGIAAHSWSGDVTLDSVTNINNNGNGVFIQNVGVTPGVGGNFSDTNSVHSGNEGTGVTVVDVVGNVTLTNVTADNNDNDNSGGGVSNGVDIRDGADGDSLAIGGNMTVTGGFYRLVDDGVGPAEHQEFGIRVRRVAGLGGIGGNLVMSGVTVTGNEETGVLIDGDSVNGTATVSTSDFSNNGSETGGADDSDGDGIRLTLFVGNGAAVGTDVSFNAVTANNNFGDGIQLVTVGDVVFTSVTAGGNDPGVLVNTAASFSDTSGVYVANDNHGIQLAAIAGNVSLTNTRAENNDADNSGTGDGVNAVNAIGGNLTITGGFSRDLGGVNDHQEFGVNAGIIGGNLVILGATVTGNEETGMLVTGTGATRTVSVSTSTFSNNGSETGGPGSTGDGINLNNFLGDGAGVNTDVTFTSVTANDNFGDGIRLTTVGDTVFTNVTANGNDPGLNISVAQSFSDTDGTYNLNDDDGIRLSTIAGNVTLIRTTADNNNADNAGFGDGVFSGGGIGGNLLVQGARFRDIDGTAGATFHQVNGMVVNSVTGSTTFNDSAGPSQSNIVTGNAGDGVFIADGGTTGTFTNGTYSSNGAHGIRLNAGPNAFSGAVTLTNVTASSNGIDGVFAINMNGTTTVAGGTFNSNGDDGLDLTGIGAGRSLLLNGTGSASSNGDDGLFATTFGTGVTIGAVGAPWTFNNNGATTATGDGIQITNSGAVTFVSVTATGNDPGANISGAASFSDTDGNFSLNDNGGILLTDIAVNVTLVRTIADNNDADNDGVGDGVRAVDSVADGDALAIGGALNVQGCFFRDTTPFTHQENGFFLTGGVGGAINFVDSAGPVQTMTVTGNEADGVHIEDDGGSAATFTNGTYSLNGDDGIFLDPLASVALNNLTASSNGGDGFEIINVTTLTVSDFIGLNNVSGFGGNVTTVTTFTFNTTTLPAANTTADGVEFFPNLPVGPERFQHTRAGVLQQPIRYAAVNTLNVNFLGGDDTATINPGTYTLAGSLNLDGGPHILGDTLLFLGTPGNDTINIGPGPGLNITVNGVSPTLGVGTFTVVNFELFGVDALAGDDTVTFLSPLIAPFTQFTVLGNNGDDLIDASAILAGPGVQLILDGGNDNDTVIGSSLADLITGGSGNDSLVGGPGNDSIDGGSGNDSINGGAGNDSTVGGTGNDRYFYVGTVLGTDTVNEAANVDTDTLDFSGFTAAGTNTINLATTGNQTVNAGDLVLNLSTNTGIENVVGSPNNDVILGNDRNNSILGGNGNDSLTGVLGNDTLNGEAGDDSLVGGAGDDSQIGGGGNDTYFFAGTVLGVDVITELGVCLDADLIDLTTFGAAAVINLGLTTPQIVSAGNLTLTIDNADGIENLIGTAFADSLTGNSCENNIQGLAGNDTLSGAGDDDTLNGGANDDLILWNFNDANDSIIGGTGLDTFQFNGNTSAVVGDDFGVAQFGAQNRFTEAAAAYTIFLAQDIESYDVNLNDGDDAATFFMPLPGLNNLVVDGDGGNDLARFDFTLSHVLPIGNPVFNGGAGVNTVQFQGTGVPFDLIRYFSDGPDFGRAAFDAAQVIFFNQTTTVNGIADSIRIRVNLTPGDDDVNVVDGPTVNAVVTTQIASNTGTFPTYNVGSTAVPLIAGLEGTDRFHVNNPNEGTGIIRIRLYGFGPAGLDDGLIDRFTIAPSANVVYSVFGGDPPPILCPGDSLDTDLSFGALDQVLIPTGPGSGRYEYSNSQDILFNSIEDLSGRQIVVTGTDFGTNQRIRVYDAVTGVAFGGVLGAGFNPFADIGGFHSGIRVAAGDVNADCYPDIIVAAGPQAPPFVRVYDGFQARLGFLAQIGGFSAFENNFTGGVFVTVADMDGDHMAEIIVGAGKPSTARVRVFSGASVLTSATPTQVFPEFVAFDATLKAGARVAAGDYNNDGQMDIGVTFGSGPVVRVRVVNGGLLGDGFQTGDLLDDFTPFETTFKRGAFLSMVDIDGDGSQEIQVSRSAEPILQNVDFTIGTTLATTGEVRSYSFDGTNHLGGAKAPDFSTVPYAVDAGFGTYNSGVRLGAWFDSANVSYFLTAPGKSQPGRIRQVGNLALTNTLFASEAFTDGYFVAGSKRNDGILLN